MFKSDYEIKKKSAKSVEEFIMTVSLSRNDGNISVKIDDDTYFVTPTGVSKVSYSGYDL